MSRFVPKGGVFHGRFPYDQYATTKSGASFLLTAALLADDIKALLNLINYGDPNTTQNYFLSLTLLVISMGFQFILMILSLVLVVKNSRKRPFASISTTTTMTRTPAGVDNTAASFGDLESGVMGSNGVTGVTVVDPDYVDPEVRRHMQRINDTLGVVSLLLVLFHIVRSANDPNVPLHVVLPTAEGESAAEV